MFEKLSCCIICHVSHDECVSLDVNIPCRASRFLNQHPSPDGLESDLHDHLSIRIIDTRMTHQDHLWSFLVPILAEPCPEALIRLEQLIVPYRSAQINTLECCKLPFEGSNLATWQIYPLSQSMWFPHCFLAKELNTWR